MKPGTKAGERRGDYHEAKKAPFLEALQRLGFVSHAARAVGISRKTVSNWCEKDSKFAEAKQEIDQQIDDQVEANLFQLTKTNPAAAIFWLCNRRKERWVNTQRMEHSGEVAGPVSAITIRVLKPGEKLDASGS